MKWSATAGIAAALILAAAGGVLVGRMTAHPAGDEPLEKQDRQNREAPEETQGAVALSADRIREAGILLVTVQRQAVAEEIIGEGVVNAATGAEGVLAARADGTLVQASKRLGDPVRAGETVALIESRDASAMASERSKAAAGLESAQARYAREKQLFEAGVTARQDFETARAELAGAEAEANRANAAASAARVSSDGRTVAVVSPVSGRISAAPVTLGAYVSSGAEIYRVIDPGRVEVRASVPAQDALRIVVGDHVALEGPDGQAAGVVRVIAPDVDPASRSATIILTPSVSAGWLKPGAALRVRIASRGRAAAPAIVVPRDAIQLMGGREVVFVKTAAGFRVRPVIVGLRTAQIATITDGLEPGEVVAGRGAFLVKAELEKPGADEDN